MRGGYLLILVSVALAAVSGLLFWHVTFGRRSADEGILRASSNIERAFEGRSPALFTINPEEIRQSRGADALLDPASLLPHAAAYPYAELSALFKYSKDCEPKLKSKIRSRTLKKALLWEEYLCGKAPRLPNGFFEHAPYIHPLGSSYAFLAYKTGRPEFQDPQWIARNWKWTHVLEVIDPRRADAPPLEQLLRRLSSWELGHLLARSNLVVNDQYVLIRHKDDPHAGASGLYTAYARKDWDHYLAAQEFFVEEDQRAGNCLLKEGNVCWVRNPGETSRTSRIAAGLMLAAFALLAGASVRSALRRSRLQREEAAHRSFILQMLTHELRTPATALQLSLESLRGDFDRLPDGSQQAFLRMCDSLQRLNRVAEASKNYLSSELGAQPLRNANVQAASVNSIVGAILEPYSPEQVRFVPLERDRECAVSRYWLELCVGNLIQNALAHGIPPVTVALNEDSKGIRVSVIDHGRCDLPALRELSLPFQKGIGSRGLGLGLAIVKKVVESMDGELSLQTHPTRFSILLRGLS